MARMRVKFAAQRDTRTFRSFPILAVIKQQSNYAKRLLGVIIMVFLCLISMIMCSCLLSELGLTVEISLV